MWICRGYVEGMSLYIVGMSCVCRGYSVGISWACGGYAVSMS